MHFNILVFIYLNPLVNDKWSIVQDPIFQHYFQRKIIIKYQPMNNNNEQQIIRKLEELQEQQASIQREQAQLIQLLKRLRIDRTETETETNEREEEEDPDKFRLGEKVTVLNPKRNQEKTGIVCNLGKEKVTIITRKGHKIVQMPFNLRKLKQI